MRVYRGVNCKKVFLTDIDLTNSTSDKKNNALHRSPSMYFWLFSKVLGKQIVAGFWNRGGISRMYPTLTKEYSVINQIGSGPSTAILLTIYMQNAMNGWCWDITTVTFYIFYVLGRTVKSHDLLVAYLPLLTTSWSLFGIKLTSFLKVAKSISFHFYMFQFIWKTFMFNLCDFLTLLSNWSHKSSKRLRSGDWGGNSSALFN